MPDAMTDLVTPLEHMHVLEASYDCSDKGFPSKGLCLMSQPEDSMLASSDSLYMDVEEELSDSACIRAVLRELTYSEPLDDQTEQTSPLLRFAVVPYEQATFAVDKNAVDQDRPPLSQPVDARGLQVKDLDEQQQQTQGKQQKGASKRIQPADEEEDHSPSKKPKKLLKKELRIKQHKLQKKLNIKSCKATSSLGRKTTSKSVVRYFSLVRDAEEAKLAGFVYRKMWVADIPVIAEGYGLCLLKDLGLDGFLLQPIPNLNKTLCDEFLFSYDHTTTSGIVNGRVVKLDAQSVAAATKLPVGEDSDAAAVAISFYTTEQSSALKRMLMNVTEKKSRGYDLGQLVYGEDVDVVGGIACGLMMRMECKRECFHCVTPEILLAIDKSIREGMQMQWAAHMAQLMSRAAKKTKMSLKRIAYQYGEWLTKIIEYAVEDSSGEQSPCLALQQGIVKQVVEVGAQTEGDDGLSYLHEQRQVQPESIGSKERNKAVEVGVQTVGNEFEANNSKLDMEIQSLRADLAAETLEGQRLQADDVATENLELREMLAVMSAREDETMKVFRETLSAYIHLKKSCKRLENELKALKPEDQH